MKDVVVEKFAGIDISKETLDVYVDTDRTSWHVPTMKKAWLES
jgi:hypothetical protein